MKNLIINILNKLKILKINKLKKKKINYILINKMKNLWNNFDFL